jgi:hypothetical protein
MLRQANAYQVYFEKPNSISNIINVCVPKKADFPKLTSKGRTTPTVV